MGWNPGLYGALAVVRCRKEAIVDVEVDCCIGGADNGGSGDLDRGGGLGAKGNSITEARKGDFCWDNGGVAAPLVDLCSGTASSCLVAAVLSNIEGTVVADDARV